MGGQYSTVLYSTVHKWEGGSTVRRCTVPFISGGPAGVTFYHQPRRNSYAAEGTTSYTAEREKRERFQVLTDVTMKTQVCCHVEPCQMDRFTLMLRALRPSPLSVTIYQTTRRHAPEDLNIQRKTNLALLRAIYIIAPADAHYSDSGFAFKRHGVTPVRRPPIQVEVHVASITPAPPHPVPCQIPTGT